MAYLSKVGDLGGPVPAVSVVVWAAGPRAWGLMGFSKGGGEEPLRHAGHRGLPGPPRATLTSPFFPG